MNFRPQRVLKVGFYRTLVFYSCSTLSVAYEQVSLLAAANEEPLPVPLAEGFT